MVRSAPAAPWLLRIRSCSIAISTITGVYIRALVNSGFSGLLWCPEVRQAESVEDLIRRLQSVVFSPLGAGRLLVHEEPSVEADQPHAKTTRANCLRIGRILRLVAAKSLVGECNSCRT